MFFHVNESGNTGLNPFNAAQSTLRCDVLGRVKNLDIAAKSLLVRLPTRPGAKRIFHRAGDFGDSCGFKLFQERPARK